MGCDQEKADAHLLTGNLKVDRELDLKAEELSPSAHGEKLLGENTKKLNTNSGSQKKTDEKAQKYKDAISRVENCKSLFEMLGVTQECTEADIKKAFKKIAINLHPDKNHAPGAEAAFKDVKSAMTLLENPETKKIYICFVHAIKSNDFPGHDILDYPPKWWCRTSIQSIRQLSNCLKSGDLCGYSECESKREKKKQQEQEEDQGQHKVPVGDKPWGNRFRLLLLLLGLFGQMLLYARVYTSKSNKSFNEKEGKRSAKNEKQKTSSEEKDKRQERKEKKEEEEEKKTSSEEKDKRQKGKEKKEKEEEQKSSERNEEKEKEKKENNKEERKRTKENHNNGKGNGEQEQRHREKGKFFPSFWVFWSTIVYNILLVIVIYDILKILFWISSICFPVLLLTIRWISYWIFVFGISISILACLLWFAFIK